MIQMKNQQEPSYSLELLKALMDNELKEIVRIENGALLITTIDANTAEEGVDCDGMGCDEFAEYLVCFISGKAENEMHANLCKDCLIIHVDLAKKHPAYIYH